MPAGSHGLGGLTSADTVVSLVMPPHAVTPADAVRAVEQVRAGFRAQASGDCDVVLLAVPAGKGIPYVDASAELLDAPRSRIILPGQP